MTESFSMPASLTDFSEARRFMIDGQLRPNDVNDPWLLKAFATVPRENFVPAAVRSTSYAERAIPLGQGRVMLEPMVLGKLLQAANVQENDRVLTVGAGLGYGAAILSQLAAHVYALECDTALAEKASANLQALGANNVQVVQGDLTEGFASGAPYDVIVLEGASAAEPASFASQLAAAGRLVAVVGEGVQAKAMLYTRTAAGLSGKPLFESAEVILPGFERVLAFAF
jgi:protein-L-isoaspartate(D-aspartate) O-methyltransferase